jgi:3-oxoacyl-[acyl-carrier protein] reductase
MDLGIAGRTAVVCGSSRGIGKACALALARAGVFVVVNGRDEAALGETVAAIYTETGVRAEAVAADITTREGQRALLAACPPPDILVNNGGAPPYRDYGELDRESILDGLRMNMVTPIELIQAVLGAMLERGFGRIVNITSVSVRMPLRGLDLSSGARAGFTAFMAGIARSVAHRNVTINHVLPGYVATRRMLDNIAAAAASTGRAEADIVAERKQLIPARRFGDPEEIGAVCAFLCSVPAGYLTGQSILVDGGLFNSTF